MKRWADGGLFAGDWRTDGGSSLAEIVKVSKVRPISICSTRNFISRLIFSPPEPVVDH
jgi:hypothetical protein